MKTNKRSIVVRKMIPNQTRNIQHSFTSPFIRLQSAFLITLLLLMTGCANMRPLEEPSLSSALRVPFVRVLVASDSTSITAGADNGFAIECIIAGEQRVYHANQPLTITRLGRTLELYAPDRTLIQNGISIATLIPRNNGLPLSIGKKAYRGLIQLLPTDTSLLAINLVYLEDYLKGVVPPEIGNRPAEEIESVKAQAVAARTYALGHLQQYPGIPYDMESSVLDQVYEGMSVEDQIASTAIAQTTGMVLLYEDEFITAYYHSTCGGNTDDIEDVWEKPAAPYLTAVGNDDACSWSKFYTWTEVFSEDTLRKRIETFLTVDPKYPASLKPITAVNIEKRTPGGRISRLIVTTTDNRYEFEKDKIRWVFRRANDRKMILPSSRFDVETVSASDGNLKTITVRGTGYGHGVGMCQCGAIGRSRQGWTFDQILRHYYRGVTVRRVF